MNWWDLNTKFFQRFTAIIPKSLEFTILDLHSSISIFVVHLLINFLYLTLYSTQLASNKLTGNLKIKVIANLLFSPNNVITTQLKFHIIWTCLKRSHISYCFFVFLPLIIDHFLASLMLMFRILSLIYCLFEAWMYFFNASKQTARPGSRPCIVFSRNCFLSLFLDPATAMFVV